MQKFEWDPDTQALKEAWVNDQVSSVNSVPIVSTGASMVYTVGARDGQWTLEAIDWMTGASVFHYVTGSARYNTQFSGVLMDQQGDSCTRRCTALCATSAACEGFFGRLKPAMFYPGDWRSTTIEYRESLGLTQ